MVLRAIDLHLFSGRGGEPKVAVTLPGGTRTKPVRLAPQHARLLLAIARRASGSVRPRRNMWPIVLLLMARDGYVSSRTLAAEAGGSASSAGWYLGRMGRCGKLRRQPGHDVPCRYEVAP